MAPEIDISNSPNLIPERFANNLNQAKEHFLHATYELKNTHINLSTNNSDYFSADTWPTSINESISLLDHIFYYGFNTLRTKGITFSRLVGDTNISRIKTAIDENILSGNIRSALNENHIKVLSYNILDEDNGILVILGYKGSQKYSLNFDQNLEPYNPLGTIMAYISSEGYTAYCGCDQKRVYDKMEKLFNNLLGISLLEVHFSDYHFRNLANLTGATITSYGSTNQQYKENKARNKSDYDMYIKFDDVGNYGRLNCDINFNSMNFNVSLSNGGSGSIGKVSFSKLLNNREYIELIKHIWTGVVNNNNIATDYQRGILYLLRENKIPHFITLCGGTETEPSFEDPYYLYDRKFRIVQPSQNGGSDEETRYTDNLGSGEIIDNVTGDSFVIADETECSICIGRYFSEERFTQLLGGAEHRFYDSRKVGIYIKEFDSDIDHTRYKIVIILCSSELLGIEYLKTNYPNYDDVLGIIIDISSGENTEIDKFLKPLGSIRGNHKIIKYGYNMDTMIALFNNNELNGYDLKKIFMEARSFGSVTNITINGIVTGSQIATENSILHIN